MIEQLPRANVLEVIDSVLAYKYSKIIITGINTSGKSTIVQKYYTEYHVFKTTAKSRDNLYFSDNGDAVRSLIDDFDYRVYDRHPAIDCPVHEAAFSNWGEEEMLSFADKYISRLKRYKAVIFFLNDKFRDKTFDEQTKNDFDACLRRKLLKNYEAMIKHLEEKLGESLSIYVVND